MSLIFVWDTETTGFVQPSLPPDHPSQPHLVQMGCLLVTEAGHEVASVDLIVKPEGYTIPEPAARTHGITTEIAHDVGIPLANVMGVFAQLRARAHEAVAFNSKFDELVVAAAFARLGRKPSHPGPDRRTCCMELASPIMELPPTPRMRAAGFDKFKPPSLKEAFAFFVDPKGFDGAHSAVVDARATQRVHQALRMLESCP